MDIPGQSSLLELALPIPSPEEQLKFITNIQRILDEGSFVATYKFALMMSLADYAVKFGDDTGNPLKLTTWDLSESFVEYYWHQAVPFVHGNSKSSLGILKQGTGDQPVIISRIVDLHAQFNGSLSAAGKNKKAWQSLLNKVSGTIAQMPLWKLQVVGRSVIPFLYEQHGTGKGINLKPGGVFCLRRFYDLIRNLVQSAWIRHVRMLNINLLGESDIGEFLFGAERMVLPGLRVVLKDFQKNVCFYCNKKLR